MHFKCFALTVLRLVHHFINLNDYMTYVPFYPEVKTTVKEPFMFSLKC